MTSWANYKSGTFTQCQLMDENPFGSRYIRWFGGLFIYDETLNHFGLFADPDNAGPNFQLMGQNFGFTNNKGIMGRDTGCTWRTNFGPQNASNQLSIGDVSAAVAAMQVVLRSGSAANVLILPNDLQIYVAGKGIVMTNAAGTVTKRVRLNDAGDGLIFEAP